MNVIIRRCFLAAIVLIVTRSAIAESIELTDGRIFNDASIMGETATRVTIRHAQGLVSVNKASLPDALQKRYPVTKEIPPAPKPAAQAAPARRPAVKTPEPAVIPAEPEAPPAPPTEEQQKAEARSRAKPLLQSYFEKRYTPIGGRVDISLKLEEPSSVDGWAGRWRMHGFATLASYRDLDPVREKTLYDNPNLTTKQVRRMIANETFIQSELVEFDADISHLDSGAEIDVTLR